jgi:hypothetical protein
MWNLEIKYQPRKTRNFTKGRGLVGFILNSAIETTDYTDFTDYE